MSDTPSEPARKPAHTPGPWWISPLDGSVIEGRLPGCPRDEFPEQEICVMSDATVLPNEQQEANARLIVEAPETKRQRDLLLEAAKAVSNAPPNWRWMGGDRGKIIRCRFCRASVVGDRSWPAKNPAAFERESAALQHKKGCAIDVVHAAIAACEGGEDG